MSRFPCPQDRTLLDGARGGLHPDWVAEPEPRGVPRRRRMRALERRGLPPLLAREKGAPRQEPPLGIARILHALEPEEEHGESQGGDDARDDASAAAQL